jgi:histidinol dehydrogenase
MLQSHINKDISALKKLLCREPLKNELLESVQKIIEEVRRNGDEALKKFLLEFQKLKVADLKVSQSEIETSENFIEEDLKESIAFAIKNIETFHKAQLPRSLTLETSPGLYCTKKFLPIEKIGIYVPAGSAPLFSSLYMAAVPAKIAGCKEITVCVPPRLDGSIHPAILYVAKLLGIKNIFKSGGAQAIAALAYGTESIPRVFKIFGPGSPYTATAKQLLASQAVDIDIVAGASEVLVIADNTARPDYIAADLLAQAEHGSTSQVVFISTSEDLISRVNRELASQLTKLPRQEEAKGALQKSIALHVSTLDQAIELSNIYAPEHLILHCSKAHSYAEKVTSAGSVFIGAYAAEVLGDYGSGTNHILPTGGWARSHGGVNILSFLKSITFQEISKEGLKGIGNSIITLARAEDLEAHARAVLIRLQ